MKKRAFENQFLVMIALTQHRRMRKFLNILILIIGVAGFSLNGYSQTYPFPTGGTYTAGYISTTNVTSARVQSAYNNWATGAPSGLPTSSASNGPGYLTYCSPGKYSVSNGGGVFSEGIGYGMLLTAYMGDHTAFDGLWNFYKANMDGNGLMNWTGGSTCGSTNSNAATDGDEDAAMALIIASIQWPASTYAADAKTLIANIKAHETTSSCSSPSTVLLPGDAWGSCNCLNPSYFAPAYYRIWACFMNDTYWNTLADDTYITLNNAINSSNGNTATGLVPAWQTNSGTPGGSSCNGTSNYQYDACRTPWRIGLDYLWFGTSAAKTYLNTVTNWVKGSGGGISNIGDGYSLNGTKTSSYRNSAFIGPFCVAAMSSSQTDADNFANWWVTESPLPGSNKIDDAPYFQNTLRALTMLTASGYMWKPSVCTPTPTCQQPALGADQSLCGSGGSITLKSNTTTATGVTFTWKKLPSTTLVNASSTTTTYSVSSAGTYVVIRDSTSCSKSDTIVVTSTLPTPVVTASTSNLCNPAIDTLTITNAASFPSGTTWQWQINKGSGYTNISGANSSTLTNVRIAASYEVIASISGCSSTTSTAVAITSSLPTPVDGCASSAPINLSITNAGTGPYQWYSSSTGGAALATGTSYSAPTAGTYYVQDASAVSATVGPTARLTTGGYASKGGSTQRLVFTTNVNNVTINKLDVYVVTYAVTNLDFTVKVYKSDGTTLVSSVSTTTITNYPNTGGAYNLVTLTLSSGLTIPTAGTGYQLEIDMSASTNGNMWYGQNVNPSWSSYTSSGIDITGNYNQSNDYSFAYNWQYSSGNACARLPVVATVGSCSSLPVDLINFYAVNNSDQVFLSWSTASERNNNYFDVERSSDGINYDKIATVKGSGNTTAVNTYSWTDFEPLFGTVYYRLVQYDYDGNSHVSEIVNVERDDNTNIRVAPNPFADETKLYISSLSEANVDITVTDLTGKILYSNTSRTNEDISLGKDLIQGVYLVQVRVNGKIFNYRIVKS